MESAPSRIGSIRVGTSGYSFDDWVGEVYPAGLPKGDRLLHYAREFPVVEVNSTYYRIPHPIVLRKMEQKTPPGFEFVVKAHKSFTHEGGREAAVVRSFLDVLEPLVESGKFRGVLLQFPWAFRRTPAALDRLAWIRDALPAMPIWVEFRHASWARDETFDFLAARDLGYCAVDEPSLRGLMPPVVRVTNGIPYFRFHGRNEQTWWGREGGDRYDYEYREEEIREWVPRIREADRTAREIDWPAPKASAPGEGTAAVPREEDDAGTRSGMPSLFALPPAGPRPARGTPPKGGGKETRERGAVAGSTADALSAAGGRRTFVFFNNCHVGQAVRSARILKRLLEEL